MLPTSPIELAELLDSFYDAPDRVGRFVEVPAAALPQPQRSLLDHNHHMTVAIEKFHQSPVDVAILQATTRGLWYAREIVLIRQSDRKVVQYGIVRMNLEWVSAAVRSEILAGEKPLGRILIEHNVLRAVKLQQLFSIVPGEVLQKVFGLSQVPDPCYGRTAVIYCDQAAAIQLLEILPPKTQS